MAKVVFLSPGISILQNDTGMSAEISTLVRMEEKFGRFSSEDKCVMFLIDDEKTRQAGSILKDKIEKMFGMQVDIVLVEGLSIENISQKRFLMLINEFVSVVSEKILSVQKSSSQPVVYVILTTGYKIISTLLSIIALIHGFEIVYLHKNAEEILLFPKLDVELGINVWLDYWNIFYLLLGRRCSIEAFYREIGCSSIPESLKPFVYIKGSEVMLTSLGKLLIERAVRFYSDDKLGIDGVWKRKFIEDCFLKHIDERLPITLMLLDIDHFKRINDEYGHDVGDAVLKEFSCKVVEFSSRFYRENGNSFIFPPQLVRWGGEEFVLIFQLKNQERDLIRQFAESVRAGIESAKFSGNIKITVSIGVATGTLNRQELPLKSLEAVFKIADENVYNAKRYGRNRVEF